MPVAPAELTIEFTVAPGADGDRAPVRAGVEAAAGSGLARETGPDTMALSGAHDDVIAAVARVLDACVRAGARAVDLRIEVPTEVRG
jgi:uncharacterized protein YqgV (UPF0045/DUF77 family)